MTKNDFHPLYTLPHPSSGIFTAGFSPNGAHLCSGGADRFVRLWDTRGGPPLRILQGHSYQVLHAVFTSDGTSLASAGGDRAVFVWDLETGTLRRKLGGTRGHAHRVNSVRFAGEGDQVLVSGSYDATVRLWDLRANNGRPIQVLQEATDSVSAIAVASGEHDFVAASVDGKVRRYDLRTSCIAEDSLPAPASSMAVSRDANCLLVTCLNDTMYLLDKASGELLSKYHGHRNASFPIQCAVLSDDAIVLCGSEDGRVCLWDIVDGLDPKRSFEPALPASVVSVVDCHPKRRMFVSATHDGNLTVWESS